MPGSCGKKFNLNRTLDNANLEFQYNVRIFISKDLTPYNQHIAWKCRERKRAGKINNCCSTNGVVKLGRTINERPIAITHNTDIVSLCIDFFSKRKQDQGE